MRPWHKRGEGEDNDQSAGWQIVFVSLGVLVIIVLVSVTRLVSQTVQNEFEDDTCRLSVLYAAGLRITQVKAFETEIRCPTKHRIVAETRQDPTNAVIAQAMAGCWKNWAEGKLNYFLDDGVFCHVCSVLTFRPNTGTVEGTNQYLRDQYVPSSNQTYLEYLSPFETQGARELLEQKVDALPPSMLKRDVDFAVIFLHVRGRDQIKDFMNKLGAGGLGTTAVVGGGYLLYASFVMEGIAAVVTAPFVAVVGVGVLAAGAITLVVTDQTTAFDAPSARTSQIMLVPYTAETLGTLNCQYAPGR